MRRIYIDSTLERLGFKDKVESSSSNQTKTTKFFKNDMCPS